MQAKQKNIRVFVLTIEDETEFFTYMEKNLILLKEYLLLLQGTVTSNITDYLNEKGCCYKVVDNCSIKLDLKEPKQETTPQKIEIVHYVQEEEHPTTPASATKTFYTPIRSGMVVEHKGDITVFGRINSGAKLLCEGNLSVYSMIDGVVECEGEYLILKEIGKGYAIFNGDIINKEQLDGKLKYITKGEEGYIMKDLT